MSQTGASSGNPPREGNTLKHATLARSGPLLPSPKLTVFHLRHPDFFNSDTAIGLWLDSTLGFVWTFSPFLNMVEYLPLVFPKTPCCLI